MNTLLLLLIITTASSLLPTSTPTTLPCATALRSLPTVATRCAFVSADARCLPEGYINYLHLFYCDLGLHPSLGLAVLLLFLTVLFYLLGTTAARHFCPSLSALSGILRLPPAIAGATLLSLGNGAPDVLSAIVSFTRADGAQDVGLNGVLGGALFVSTVVAGAVSLTSTAGRVCIDKASFIRDASFLLVAAVSVGVIIHVGRIDIWGAIAFTSVYVVYVLLVSTSHLCTFKPSSPTVDDLDHPLLPTVAKDPTDPNPILSALRRVLWYLELPLNITRRLTIPDISEERWCKPVAVASVTLSPVVLSLLFNSKRRAAVYVAGGLLGLGLGVFAAATTKRSGPPKRFALAWVAGGFVMSVTWAYALAEELISLLIAVGAILGVSPAFLGLTVLAWGNSIGDLIANVAMAWSGGSEGVQVAISGCYAGPVFNSFFGLGVSLMLAAWGGYPSAYVIEEGGSVFQTLGFLVGGLLWALLTLVWRGMRLGRVLGVGLLGIYLSSLCLRIVAWNGW